MNLSSRSKNILGIVLAVLAALFYALSTPFSKYFLQVETSPSMTAAFLYLGAGLGMMIIFPFRFCIKKEKRSKLLGKSDVLYVILMVVLDIVAPILFLYGVKFSSSSSASLLNNFEIVATALIALFIFKEFVSPLLWVGISLVTVSSVILCLDFSGDFSFSYGSLLVLGATLVWGLENNCTRKISDKSAVETVLIKGLGSGTGSLIFALIIKESFPSMQNILLILLLGFVAYGLSILTYILAQRYIGAAKTSAFYAIAPFISVLLSFLFLGERPYWTYYLALGVMIIATIFIIVDTLKNNENKRDLKDIEDAFNKDTHNPDDVVTLDEIKND